MTSMTAHSPFLSVRGRAEQVSSACMIQTSICSAVARASSVRQILTDDSGADMNLASWKFLLFHSLKRRPLAKTPLRWDRREGLML